MNINFIKPINTSGRTKEQIVQWAEKTWMRKYLLIVEPCERDCRCMSCFDKAVDALLDKSERELNGCQVN